MENYSIASSELLLALLHRSPWCVCLVSVEKPKNWQNDGGQTTLSELQENWNWSSMASAINREKMLKSTKKSVKFMLHFTLSLFSLIYLSYWDFDWKWFLTIAVWLDIQEWELKLPLFVIRTKLSLNDCKWFWLRIKYLESWMLFCVSVSVWWMIFWRGIFARTTNFLSSFQHVYIDILLQTTATFMTVNIANKKQNFCLKPKNEEPSM